MLAQQLITIQTQVECLGQFRVVGKIEWQAAGMDKNDCIVWTHYTLPNLIDEA